jgi:hypothetical protein
LRGGATRLLTAAKGARRSGSTWRAGPRTRCNDASPVSIANGAWHANDQTLAKSPARAGS